METKPKSKIITLLLALFLGSLGLHRFYVGKLWTGLILLFLSVISMLTIGLIWSLIDVVRILTGGFKDKDGRDLE